jgi:hypothetical protein
LAPALAQDAQPSVENKFVSPIGEVEGHTGKRQENKDGLRQRGGRASCTVDRRYSWTLKQVLTLS